MERDESVKYFEWDQIHETWSEISFEGVVEGNYLTADKANELYAPKSHTHESIDTKLDEIEEAVASATQWTDI